MKHIMNIDWAQQINYKYTIVHMPLRLFIILFSKLGRNLKLPLNKLRIFELNPIELVTFYSYVHIVQYCIELQLQILYFI